jgi:hypothetical protein
VISRAESRAAKETSKLANEQGFEHVARTPFLCRGAKLPDRRCQIDDARSTMPDRRCQIDDARSTGAASIAWRTDRAAI